MTDRATLALDSFDPFKNLFVGYDSMLDRLMNTSSTALKYPPYNIVKNGDMYVIEIAVAGFSKEDIDITLENNKLVVRGNKTKVTDVQETYVYHGLATRSFEKTFGLAENFEIKEASIVDGVLRITCEEVIPEYMKPKSIPIL